MNAWARVLLSFGMLTLLVACERDPRQPNYEFLPDMAHSVPYDAFAPNPNTRDHKTLLSPVTGTIARGQQPYHYSADEVGLQRAAAELKNPVPLNKETFARGKQVYETFCLVCHGVGGEGDGPLIPKFPNPPSLIGQKVKDYPEGRFFHVMTVGSAQMASYAAQVKPEDRWKVVYYIRSLQGLLSPESLSSQSETLPQEGASHGK